MKLMKLESYDTLLIIDQIELLKQDLENTLIPETVAEITDFGKNLKDIKEKIEISRKEFFKDLTTNQKLIISLENDINKKIIEAREKITELNKAEFEKIYELNKEKVTDSISLLITHEKTTTIFDKELRKKVKELSSKIKKDVSGSNILTSKNELNKATQTELENFINVLESAVNALGSIGIERFKNNSLNLSEALNFEKTQIELIENVKKQKEIQEISKKAELEEIERLKLEAQEKAKNEIKEQIAEDEESTKPDFEIIEEVNVKYLRLEYTNNQKEEANKLIKELKELGIKITIKSNKEEL